MSEKSPPFLALLRGINVGGKNVISKGDLKACFEELGCARVRTYIQSGNILFRSAERSTRKLTATIEAGLSKRFKYQAQAVVLPRRKYQAMVAAAPREWGHDDARKHNALFTLTGTTARRILSELPPPRREFETITPVTGVIFWSISKQHQSKTTLMKLAQGPAYQQVTVRNHNTVFKLLELFGEI